MAVGGAILRISQTTLRVIQLLASILVLGVFSYFLAVLADHDLPIARWIKAVEGISGAAVLYLAFAVFLTICLGGIAFFAFLAIVLDICFIGCFAAVAVLNRGGAHSCSGTVSTPLGTGSSDSNSAGYGDNGFGFGSGENVTYFPNLGRACKLEKAVFAVSILNIVLFILTAIGQVALVRHHKREKRFGPSPANNYTAGSGRRAFWRRNRKTTTTHPVTTDAEMGTVPAGNGVRPSGDTAYTGSTAAAGEPYGTGAPNKYGAHTQY